MIFVGAGGTLAAILGDLTRVYGSAVSQQMSTALANGRAVALANGVRLVAAGGGNIVAAGGGNLVAAGGGNVIAHPNANLIQDGGAYLRSFKPMVSPGNSNLISVNHNTLFSGIVSLGLRR